MNIHDAISYRFQAPSAATSEPAKKAYNSLCVVNSTPSSQQTKKRIIENLLATGFDVNAAIGKSKISGKEINLLDLLIEQEDDGLIRFLMEEKGANPSFCNADSKSHHRMTALQSPFSSIDMPSSTSGTATSTDQIEKAVVEVSKSKSGQRPRDIAKIPLKMLAFGVGSLMYGLSMFANVALPVMIYLPFVAPVLVAWTVGYAIDKVCKNDKLYVTQGLGEFVATPAYVTNAILGVARGALGLVSRIGAELMHAGYGNKEFHAKLIDNIWISMSDLNKHGHTPLDLSYEKIVGTRPPSFVGEYLDCSLPDIWADAQEDSFWAAHPNKAISPPQTFHLNGGIAPGDQMTFDIKIRAEASKKLEERLDAQTEAKKRAQIEDGKYNAYLSYIGNW